MNSPFSRSSSRSRGPVSASEGLGALGETASGGWGRMGSPATSLRGVGDEEVADDFFVFVVFADDVVRAFELLMITFL